MSDKEKKRKSSFKLKNVLNFFEELIRSSQPTSPAKNVSSADETCNISVKSDPTVQKEVLIHWPTADESNVKENDKSKTPPKAFQDKDNKDWTRPVEREVDTQECVIDSVKAEEGQHWERNLIHDKSESIERLGNEQHSVQSNSPRQFKLRTEEEQLPAQNMIRNRNRQDRSKSVERPTVQSDSSRQCKLKTEEQQLPAQNMIRNKSRQDRSKSVERLGNEQYSIQSYLPKPCKFKTEDGRWFCQVCSWTSSNSTLTSFLDHCSSKNHRERMKGRFDIKQELGRLNPYNLSEVRNKTDEPQADSQCINWSERKKDGEISVEIKKQQANVKQQKEKSKICNTKKPTTEMICKSQQTQNRVCPESSKQEGLTLRMKDLLKGLPIEEPFKTLTVTHALPQGKTLNDKGVNEKKPEVGTLKEKLFEVVRQEEKAKTKKGKKKRAKKITDEKTNLDVNKIKTDSKVNTNGGGGEGSSQSEGVRIAEIKKLISAFGITFIEPVSVSFLNCKVCEKLVPAGSDFETLVINVGIHVEGKPHLKKLDAILESSNALVNLMKAIR